VREVQDGGGLRLLDLFCGAGGAAMGCYHRAGFDEIVGVDIKPQPRYPFAFVQVDALEALDELVRGGFITDTSGRRWFLSDFEAVHASPPCQRWVNLANASWLPTRHNHPDLLTPTLERMKALKLAWVCENVPGSPIVPMLRLCGSTFGLRVRRHRHFNSNRMLLNPNCRHREQGAPIGVYGNGGPENPGGRGRRYKNLAEAADAMGIDWMRLAELRQAIPPAYTEYIGRRLLEAAG